MSSRSCSTAGDESGSGRGRKRPSPCSPKGMPVGGEPRKRRPAGRSKLSAATTTPTSRGGKRSGGPSEKPHTQPDPVPKAPSPKKEKAEGPSGAVPCSTTQTVLSTQKQKAKDSCGSGGEAIDPTVDREVPNAPVTDALGPLNPLTAMEPAGVDVGMSGPPALTPLVITNTLPEDVGGMSEDVASPLLSEQIWTLGAGSCSAAGSSPAELVSAIYSVRWLIAASKKGKTGSPESNGDGSGSGSGWLGFP